MDIVTFLNDLTNGHLLAWKTALTSLVLALAGVQLALAGRFWKNDGLPVRKRRSAATFHRWNGRLLIVVTVAVGYACLFVQAGPTTPLRILFHSIFGATLFVLLGIKIAAVRLVHGRDSLLPMVGSALFINYLVLWLLSAADYVTRSSDPAPSTPLVAWAAACAAICIVFAAFGYTVFARRFRPNTTVDN